MESTKNRKKGLLSIVALIVCLAMLTVGTFAWFTDTATVKGNKVYAGTLAVDVVATVDEVLNAFAQDYYGQNYAGLSEDEPESPETDPEGGTFAPKAFVNKKFNDQSLKICQVGQTPNAKAGSTVKAGLTDTPLGEVKAEENGTEYVILTGKTVPIVRITNLEPGKTYPVRMNVKNSGELAISYAAGFSVDDGNSKTGLQALEAAYPKTTDKTKPEYIYLRDKLVPKQLAKDADGKDQTYLPSMAGTEDDLGGKLENVLEVYAMTENEYNREDAEGNPLPEHAASMELLKEEDVEGTGKTANYIGTIAQIMHCNDTAYKQTLSNKKTAKDSDIADKQTVVEEKTQAYTVAAAAAAAAAAGDETKTPAEKQAAAEAADVARVAMNDAIADLNKAQGELTELTKEAGDLEEVRKRLAKASSGYCVPSTKLEGGDIPIYGRDGQPVKEGGVAKTVERNDIGTAYFAIHMPGSVDDTYQNAMLTLNAGITASQVELDTDGINVMIYDNAEARTAD